MINFKMIGEGNQSMDWIGQKLRQSGQQMAEDYSVPTGSGKHFRVSKLVHFALKCHKSFVCRTVKNVSFLHGKRIPPRKHFFMKRKKYPR